MRKLLLALTAVALCSGQSCLPANLFTPVAVTPVTTGTGTIVPGTGTNTGICDPTVNPACTGTCNPATDPACVAGCDPSVDPTCGQPCDPSVDPNCGTFCDPAVDPSCAIPCDPNVDPACTNPGTGTGTGGIGP